ncbi:MAG: hypothetical protein NTX22_10770 [Ignavibacteriales bacterium]|nr:hypothetical protein [Ignavibacteriales bacterium]
MGGKASLYMVLGFSLIFMIVGYNFSSLTRRAVNNEFNYYNETMAHDITVSGANMASNQIFMDKTWDDGYSNLSFNGGTINVAVSSYAINKVKVFAIGTYGNASDTIQILLQPSSFAKFAYYMNIFPGNLFFYTGDTVSGPFHTQQKLSVKGRPVFYGKASAKNGLQLVNNNPKTNPEFNGGFESGIDIPLVTDFNTTKTAAQAGGAVIKNNSGGKIDVKMTFNADGTMTFKKSTNSGSSWSADTTVNLATFAPNGVIFVDKGNAYIQGVVNGQYTVAVDQSSGSGSGNVYLEGDITYHNPLVYNPVTHLYDVQGNDMLGIVASNNVQIVDNAANRSNINIHASILSMKGGLGLTNNNMPASGSIKLVGGLIEYQSQITGTINGSGTLTNGYNEKIYFDQRFKDSAPPYFPTTGKLEVIAWYESTWVPDPKDDWK